MKLAIPASGKDLNGAMDGRFGRAAGFIIYDTETGSHEYIDNAKNLDAAQGAGIQSAKTVTDSGAGVLITGNVGPKAHAALTAAGIEIFLKNEGTVGEAIEAYRSGSLEKTAAANVQGHW
jgi:predicted Fe-Mo cluster-binding NifX family protein